MGKNAYFQISVEEKEVFLNIYAASDGGKILTTNEVANYLTVKNIPFDLVKLDAVLKDNEDKRIKLADGDRPIESAMCNITVSDDKMTAYARIYPPFAGGKPATADEIASDLKLNGIKYGTDKEMIDRFVSHPAYCTTFVVAKGLPVTEGEDAVIDYHFNTDLSGRPAQNEDGSVDFHNLNTVCQVQEGDVLATMKPAVNGRAGMNVLGEILKPREVKKLKFAYGNNISVSEDGLSLITNVTGLVNLVEEKVFVSNVMEVNDVDASTGDIDFDGGVLIRGDVKTGYRVKATGDIDIKGAVENAEVISGGQIVVARGINGNSTGTLKAEGNVICKYIQNARVFAGGYVETDCVIHSEIVAGTRICVQGKKGFINGGSVRAKTEIEVKTLGSEMGTMTSVEVGVDPIMRDEYNRLKKEVADLQKSLAQNEPLAVALITKLKSGQRMSPEQKQQAMDLAKLVTDQKNTITNNTLRIGELEVALDMESTAVLRVTGKAYPGVVISISGATLNLKTEYHFCRFIREGADVVMAAM